MSVGKDGAKGAAKKRGLGRGLEALLGPKAAAEAPPLQAMPGDVLRTLPIDAMVPGKFQPRRTMDDLRRNWSSKNVDMSWTRLTVWRAMLASMLDQPPHLPVSGVRVTGKKDYLPMDLLAAWLRLRLNVPVVVEDDPNATAVTGVYLSRSDGVMSLERPSTDDGSPC